MKMKGKRKLSLLFVNLTSGFLTKGLCCPSVEGDKRVRENRKASVKRSKKEIEF